MKDNDISSNSISGVSLERRKNKRVFAEELDYHESILWRKRAKRNLHLVHVNTLNFFGFVFWRVEGWISRTKEVFKFGNRPLHDRIDQPNLRCKDLVIRQAHVHLKIQQQRQNICELQFCIHTLQVLVLDEKVQL